MSLTAKDIMTPDPQTCTAEQTLNDVAKMMVECNCGEIPVVDAGKKLVGVVTDRDIVCRVVAVGKDPSAVTAEQTMSQPVISVLLESSLDAVMAKMEEHQNPSRAGRGRRGRVRRHHRPGRRGPQGGGAGHRRAGARRVALSSPRRYWST